MRKIAVLDQHTIDKIAAGEVVERPSSVVKELVENAIDAGATAVTVEISDGGKKLIRITDNGAGMEREQVPLAFLRHATSKIEKVEDLEHIVSLGFRGEALSSIAAVSQVELITKTPSSLSGIRYLIEGGKEERLEELGAPEGTTFLVRNLFYNTPARSKFLKSDMTEGNYISILMEQLALSHPEISFKYIQNRQVKLHTSGNYSIKDVIYNIYGREITKSLLEVTYENDFMKITGFVGKPEISRGNRSFENYYVNGRYVKNKIITKAVEDAYKGFLMQHKFPFISLHIQMEGNDLDVNVHPTKMEVRFARGAEVYDGIYDTVYRALTRREMIPQVSVGKEDKEKSRPVMSAGSVPEPFETKRLQQAAPLPHQTSHTFSWPSAKPQMAMEERKYTTNTAAILSGEEEQLFQGTLKQIPKPKPMPETAVQETPIEDNHMHDVPVQDVPVQDVPAQNVPVQDVPAQEVPMQESSAQEAPVHKNASQEVTQLELFDDRMLSKKARSRHQLIGQIFDTYWLVQYEDKFYIIDQHAAHEKIYYERLVKQFREQTIQAQYLSPPLIVTLNLQEENLVKAKMDYFREFGFEIEPFGGKEYCISAVPVNLYGVTEQELFLEMLDQLSAEGEKDSLEFFASKLATMACKAAVKGNHKLSVQEANELIDELLTLDNPYHCPHGRPTIISMTKAELEKKFKRIV